MKRYFIILVITCFGLMFSNCNQGKSDGNNNNSEIKFLDHTLKSTIDIFIDSTDIEPAYKYNELLVNLYRNNNTFDTILSINNSPIVEKSNFMFSSNYRDYKVYFYSPQKFRYILYNWVDTLSVNKGFPNEPLNSVDISYQTLYKVTNDTIVRYQVPIEIE